MQRKHKLLAAVAQLGLALAMVATLGFAGAAQAQDQPTVVLVSNASYGMQLTDPGGWTLYAWEGDQEGVSNCYGACTGDWPPYTISGDLIAPDGLPGSLGLIDRGDGSWQVALDNWPLYYFAGDMMPGDVNGDGSMGFGARWDVMAWGTPSLAVAPAPSYNVGQPVPAYNVSQPAPSYNAPGPEANVPYPGPSMAPYQQGPFMNAPPGYGQPYGAPPMYPGPGLDAYAPTVTAVAAPNGTVTLSWMPLPDATAYRIYQASGPGLPNLSMVQTVNQSLGFLATNATVGGLVPGATYSFQVRAVQSNGAEIAAPATALGGPGGPGGLPIGFAPPTLSLMSTTGSTASLSWSPVPGAASYSVWLANSASGPFVPAATTNLTGTGTTISGLAPNTTYFVQVTAMDSLGNPSPPSNTLAIATGTPTSGSTTVITTTSSTTGALTAPTGLGISSMTGTTATLTWAASPNATSYTVWQSTSASGPFARSTVGSQTSSGATVTGLSSNTTYYFQLTATDSAGNQSAPSTTISAATTSLTAASTP